KFKCLLIFIYFLIILCFPVFSQNISFSKILKPSNKISISGKYYDKGAALHTLTAKRSDFYSPYIKSNDSFFHKDTTEEELVNMVLRGIWSGFNTKDITLVKESDYNFDFEFSCYRIVFNASSRSITYYIDYKYNILNNNNKIVHSNKGTYTSYDRISDGYRGPVNDYIHSYGYYFEQIIGFAVNGILSKQLNMSKEKKYSDVYNDEGIKVNSGYLKMNSIYTDIVTAKINLLAKETIPDISLLSFML
ncbi:unnamed protein product, partial [marine sediment metagenome]